MNNSAEMLPMLKTALLLFASFCTGSVLYAASPAAPSYQVIAYVFSPAERLQPGQIDSSAVTRINYAFANVEDGRMVIGNPDDPANLAMLASLRNSNPSLKILISVGGWLWSGGFSDAAQSVQSRQKFIQSAIGFINLYHLDGLDIDWEYPGMPGAGHSFRSEDGQNFTALLRELRAEFNRQARKTGTKLLLTIAAGASDEFLAHTDMRHAATYLDTVNLMSYDYYEPGSGPTTGNHAPLFTDPADPEKVSADASVKVFEKAGVPAKKLVVGVPFYGHMWGHVPAVNHGLFQPGASIPNAYAPFSLIESSMLNHGFTRYWDSASSAPYLYSPDKQIFVSYEDVESVALKCRYVRTHHLAGVMFWSYLNDSHGKLLSTIASELLHRRPPAASQP